MLPFRVCLSVCVSVGDILWQIVAWLEVTIETTIALSNDVIADHL